MKVNKNRFEAFKKEIRTCCGIGNWNTALKHCLDLSFKGGLRGRKLRKVGSSGNSTKEKVRMIEKGSRDSGVGVNTCQEIR